MSNGNFTNGSLAMRVWRFDGTGEVLAKFQYFSDAELYCNARMADDKERGANKDRAFFYLAVCDYECKFRAFDTKEDAKAGAA